MLTDNITSLIGAVYSGINSDTNPPPPKFFANCIILAACNHNVNKINADILSCMPGEEVLYHSVDEVVQDEG
ncbi:hypothetical protein EDD16DRAFT_1480347 [Pisolithus croceorrhizus]|nr:hypothetical protein EV401DRAFT_1871355 [Pisolithus croceorrhizus]KAI6119138.1 hypothetical protein EDD16DRAFT_1480347 [Pisolithus croceorrhizus]